MNQVTKD